MKMKLGNKQKKMRNIKEKIENKVILL